MLLFLVSFSCLAKPIQIVFVVPDFERPTYFWHLVSEVAVSVAQDVDVELEVQYSDFNRFATRDALRQILRRETRPDYIIFRPFQGNSIEVFDLLEEHEIPFVTLEQAFDKEEAILIQTPRTKYKFWLGAMNYDNVAGGALLTSALRRHHKLKNPGLQMSLTGMGGDFDQVSMARQANLDDVENRPEDLKVNQVFPMQWSPDVVAERFKEVYQRYPDTNIFWCAGDLMGVEVANQFDRMGWPKDKAIIIGGFDWLPSALELISEGKLTASVGGHFMMAGKAILNLVEYHNGNDVFIQRPGLELYELIDSDNIEQYLPFMQAAPWFDVDFKQFLRTSAGNRKNMSIANLFEAYSAVQHNKKSQSEQSPE